MEITGWPDACEECGRALKGPEAYGVEIVQFTGGATICGACYEKRVEEKMAQREAERKQRANFNAIADGMMPPYASEY